VREEIPESSGTISSHNSESEDEIRQISKQNEHQVSRENPIPDELQGVLSHGEQIDTSKKQE
jgi:hypothetical protein